MIRLFPPNINFKEKFFWLSLYIYIFGYACLGLPGMAGLRAPICGIVALSSVIVFFDHLHTGFHTSLSFGIIVLTSLGMLMGWMNDCTPTGLVLDTTVCISMLLAVHLLKYSIEDVMNYLAIAGILSIICFAICYFYNPLDISAVLGRGSVSYESFSAASMLWPKAIIVSMFIAHKDEKRWYLYFALIYWALCIWFNMLYLKRAIFADSAFMLIAIFWLYKKTYGKSLLKTTLYIIFVGIFASVVIYFLSKSLFHFDLAPIIERILERFDEVDETGTVRIDEARNYFESANFFDYIFGKGFGVQHHGLGMDKTNTALHIGIYNIILKHGIFLIIPYSIAIIRIFIKMLSPYSALNYNKSRLASMAAVFATSMPFIFYSNAWATSPVYCMMWFSIFYSLYGNYYEK